MRVREILDEILSQTYWVDLNNTVDRVVAGDPETEVDRCLVTWMPGYQALRAAVDRGIALVIGHEPTFWNHGDDVAPGDPIAQEKHRFILDNGLVVMRIHDAWDRWPGIGVAYSWAQFLGLGHTPKRFGSSGYQHRYNIKPTTFDKLAGQVARRCADLGEPLVQAIGDGATRVSRIGVGAGCGCDINVFIEMGCDCSVVVDDGSLYWAHIQRAEDMQHPVIRVNHGTSEEPGMITLARYINDNIDGVQAEYFPHRCTFRLVGGDAIPPNEAIEPTP